MAEPADIPPRPDERADAKGADRSVGSPLWVHALLFVLTLGTTTLAGAGMVGGAEGGSMVQGLAYSIPLMSILVCHEFGHYIAARIHRVPASLPYFIPLPPFFLFGTMGAIIRMADAPSDRRKLLDIGAAGPLAGLVVAIPVLIYGLSLSEVHPIAGNSWQEGDSLLYAALKLVVKGRLLPDGQNDVFLHPTAFAGWAGLFITMINLLPFGQLDGGHITMAYFGNRYSQISRRLLKALPLMGLGVFAWVWWLAARTVPLDQQAVIAPWQVALQAGLPWLVWFGLLKLMRRMSGGIEHPPVSDGPLGRGRRAVFWIVAVMFVLIFMPVPLRLSLGAADENSNSADVSAPRENWPP